MTVMTRNIGKFTAPVNGYLTASRVADRAVEIPLMLQDVLDRVERRLAAVGLSASRASALAGLSKDAIRNMQRAAKDPASRQGVSTRTINALAPVLQTSAGWLLTGEGSEDEVPAYIAKAPLLSWISAGRLAQAEHVEDIATARRVQAADLDPSGDWIALTVEGDSMDRISPPESIIFVNRRDQRLVPNACYVIQDEAGGATYKRFRPSPDRWEPVSVNPDHEPFFIEPGKGPKIIGRVRKTVLDL